MPLSGLVLGNEFTVGWDLTADQGLHLGGWQLDDVCIVANINSVCGDGVRSPTEGCDDGAANADRPDTCRSYCLRPTCGDQILDSGEECDHGRDLLGRVPGSRAADPGWLMLDGGRERGLDGAWRALVFGLVPPPRLSGAPENIG